MPLPAHDVPQDAQDLKDYHPDTFSHRHRLVVLMSAAGWKNKDIAQHMGFSQSRVSVILNDPRARGVLREESKKVAEGLDDVRRRLEILSREAVDELEDELHEVEDPRVRQRAAFGILDRAGYGKTEKKEVRHGTLDEEDSSQIAQALRESSSGETVDADYEIVGEEEDG